MLLSEDGFNEAIQVFRTQEHVTGIALDAVSMMSDNDDPHVIHIRTRLQETLKKSFDELDQRRDLIDGRYTYNDYLRDHGVNPSAHDNKKGANCESRTSVQARYSLSEVMASYWRRRSPQRQRPQGGAGAAPQAEARRAHAAAPNAPGAAGQEAPRATSNHHDLPAHTLAPNRPAQASQPPVPVMTAYVRTVLPSRSDASMPATASIGEAPSTPGIGSVPSQTSASAQPAAAASSGPSKPGAYDMTEAIKWALAMPSIPWSQTLKLARGH
jgi:hypothetical protein